MDAAVVDSHGLWVSIGFVSSNRLSFSVDYILQEAAAGVMQLLTK